MTDIKPIIASPGGSTTAARFVFAKGLLQVLQPVISECDERIQGVSKSQVLLSQQLDFLSLELQKFNDMPGVPPLNSYISKLVHIRQRLVIINSHLSVIQRRLERLKREHSSSKRGGLFSSLLSRASPLKSVFSMEPGPVPEDPEIRRARMEKETAANNKDTLKSTSATKNSSEVTRPPIPIRSDKEDTTISSSIINEQKGFNKEKLEKDIEEEDKLEEKKVEKEEGEKEDIEKQKTDKEEEKKEVVEEEVKKESIKEETIES